jgi:hypothetical protein
MVEPADEVLSGATSIKGHPFLDVLLLICYIDAGLFL